MSVTERRQDGVRRDPADGGHGAVQRGAAGGHEAALGRPGRAGVLRPLQRVPAERLRQIVSDVLDILYCTIYVYKTVE